MPHPPTKRMSTIHHAVPVELDVFFGPHRLMKRLLQDVEELLTERTFDNSDEYVVFLQNLSPNFLAFQSHEEIENRYILQELSCRLALLYLSNENAIKFSIRVSDSVKTTLQNNLHNTQHLSDVLALLKTAPQSLDNWPLFREQLKRVILAFTLDFIPHMNEEEQVSYDLKHFHCLKRTL